MEQTFISSISNLRLISGAAALVSIVICVTYFGSKISGKVLESISRQPEASNTIMSVFILSMALVEIFFLIAIGIAGYLIV